MSRIEFAWQCQPKSDSQAVRAQFGVKALLWAVAFVCAELAAIRAGGRTALPLCINLAACAFFLTFSYRRSWTAVLLGLLVGGCVAEGLLYSLGIASTANSTLFVSTIATLGSWLGIGIYAIWIDDFLGMLSMIPACSWGVVIIEWATRLFE